ncbi:MAG TPA: hypothetical protein DIW26_05365, partial [Ruminococcus sp.]|nr:hypothetical protein [Ruminococcus sp.]
MTDTLPSNYSYDDVTGYPVNAWICDFNENGGYNTQSGTKVDVPNPVKSGNTVTWSFTGDNYKLAPGKCLVLEFSTVSKTDLEGVITNSGYAEINQNFTDEDVIAGNKQDNKIYNYANYNIVGLTTESWKTITYTNQGHNGTPHTDPETDTGNSRDTTHNYVQGVQGEKVTYTINVTNNSPVSIENFTVIDRLPYVNDKGLVSGYERNSAFGVQFSEILSVKVGDITIESSKYQLSFSTDKTSVLNEYSGDWSGKNDVMTWTSDSTNAINFRVLIDSSVKVKPNETVVITFKGIVPSYVEKTGISNIAWNSFAYAYQNTEILGDTVMVAEPAKVGVWVETPATANKIIINKTVENSTGGTFWFALFKDGTTTGSYERISDMVSVQLAENSTTGNVTMDNLDFASIKEVNQADNIYLFETTEKGDILTNQNSVYSPSYTTGNTIDTSKTENIVDVTNTKETGSISFTKTVAGNDDGITDTFWFGLFTKQGNEFIRYEDAGIKSAVIKGNGSEKVTFSDIPNNSTFYVFETNENGVIVDTLEKGVQTLYTGSQNGEKYLVNNTGSDGVKAGEEFTVTNTKQVNYQITVDKILLSDDVKASQVFYVGLYNSETATTTDIVKSFTSETEAVFTYLDGSKTYYVAECDKDGNRYDSTFTQFVYLNNSENPIERTFTVTYENNTVSFADDSEQYVSVTNTDTSRKTGIIINKNIISAAQPTKDMTINFGIYTIDSEGQYKLSKTVQAVVSANAFKQNTDGTYSASVSFKAEDLAKGEYYVFEINSDTILDDGDIVEINDNNYVVSYENGNMVYLDGTIDGNVTISNKNSNESEIYIKKIDVTGKPLAGAELTITTEDISIDLSNVKINDTAANPITWTTSDDKNDVKITGLPDGTYTLAEKAYNNYKGISVKFEVENGYIKYSGNDKAVYNVTADSMTIMNKAVVNVSKKDMGGTELEGALIKIVPDSDTVYLTNTEISRNGTTFEKAAKTDTDGNMFDNSDKKIDSSTKDYTNYYYSDEKTIIFYSDGNSNTEITGLPDGTYTMTEVIA